MGMYPQTGSLSYGTTGIRRNFHLRIHDNNVCVDKKLSKPRLQRACTSRKKCNNQMIAESDYYTYKS